MKGERGKFTNAWGELEYTLRFPTHVVSYRAKDGYADLNVHARTQIDSTTSTGAPCEYLGDGSPCWFDGTGLAPVLEDEDEIYALMERYWPERWRYWPER